MFKNVAGQKATVFAFDATTNLPKTGDAANITAYCDLDDAGVNALADTSASEIDATNAKGYYSFDLAQGETNANKILYSGKSSTSNIVVIARPDVVYTVPVKVAATIATGDAVDLTTIATTLGSPANASVSADIAAVSTTLASYPSLAIPATISSSAPTSTQFTVTFSGTISAAMAASWEGLNCFFSGSGKSPQNLPIASVTFVDTNHATLNFDSPGFSVSPAQNDAVEIGGMHG